MKLLEGKTWLEVIDWENAGYKLHTIIDSIGKNRKSWSCITTQGRGREMLFLYDSLCEKHKALFAEAVKKFLQEQEALKANSELEKLKNKILSCVQTNPQDILYFQNLGFSGEKTSKSQLYARRAAWLRFLASLKPATIKQKFTPLKSKEEFLRFVLPLIHAENCFEFRTANLQYLKIRLVRWNKEGLQSCIDGRNGKQNARKVCQNTEKLLLSLLANIKKPTIQEIYETYNNFLAGNLQISNTETGEIYNPANFPAVSYATLYKLATKQLNKALYTLTHGTELSFREAHDFYAKRKRPEYFGSMLTADDWDVNVNVEIKISGKLYKKIYAYLFFDVATRHCVGYAWAFEKTTELFLNALRNTLANPCWQGKAPYELQGESNLLKALNEDILKELFAETKILPKNPMAKYAERDIEALKYQVFAKYPEYKDYFKGRHYGRREAWRLEKDQQKEVKYFTEVAQIEKFLQNIVDKYNELYPISAELHPDLLPQNSERLAYHLGEVVKTSYRNGRLQAKNEEWVFLDIDKLKHKHIEVRFWQNEAFVYQDGIFLGKAEKLQAAQASKLESTQEDSKIKGKQLQAQKKIRNKVATQAQKADKLLIAYEQLSQEAQRSVFERDEKDIYTLIGEKYLQELKQKAI